MHWFLVFAATAPEEVAAPWWLQAIIQTGAVGAILVLVVWKVMPRMRKDHMAQQDKQNAAHKEIEGTQRADFKESLNAVVTDHRLSRAELMGALSEERKSREAHQLRTEETTRQHIAAITDNTNAIAHLTRSGLTGRHVAAVAKKGGS